MTQLKKKPKRSLRTILILWFLLFSITPLAFVTLYSMYKYKSAMDKELSLRLEVYTKDIKSQIKEIDKLMANNQQILNNDATLLYHLKVQDKSYFSNIFLNQFKKYNLSAISFFNREGQLITNTYLDMKSQPKTFVPAKEAIFLSSEYIKKLNTEKQIYSLDFSSSSISLIMLTKIIQSGKIIGFVEQNLMLTNDFVEKLKSDLKLEIMIFSNESDLVLYTHKDFALYRDNFFKKNIGNLTNNFFELNIRREPYGFTTIPISWGELQIPFAIGVSKAEMKNLISNVNITFLSVVAIVVILLILTILITSKFVLKPIYDLVGALQTFESQEQAVTISFNDNTEVGLLTKSFNEMSKKIWQAKHDLKKKITELEKTNKELKDTQMKLVHSAKMVSLGQLVAGVAHELNNPIAFIYSNMSHLRDYSQRLIHLLRVAENNPVQLSEKKLEHEFDYVVEDLPKLITSCEEGSQRLRDIVLGLRNFSRLEASKLQEVDIHQNIETTLGLLQGEIKNRIQIFRQYSEISRINCYSSQINQVFMNIISNAIHAIEGQGKLWITTKNSDSSKDEPERVQVSIQDSGKGIPSDILDKIFDPFFTTKGVGQGTGLGLSISYGIIQNHGGEILVKSEVGVGTEFIITLPVNPPVDKLDN